MAKMRIAGTREKFAILLSELSRHFTEGEDLGWTDERANMRGQSIYVGATKKQREVVNVSIIYGTNAKL